MTRYATIDDLVARYGATELAQRTDRISGEILDESIVARALDDADAEIDSSIGRRYALPVASVPPLLTRIACSLARYFIYADAATTRVRDDYEDALKVLAEIRNGTRTLPLAATAGGGNAEGVSTASSAVQVRAPGRIFTSDLMTRFGRL